MVINLSVQYFGLSKDSVAHFERGLFVLVHHDCSHLVKEGLILVLGNTFPSVTTHSNHYIYYAVEKQSSTPTLHTFTLGL